METHSVTYDIIKNKACIVCGATFKVPRAGKLYCSSGCKQFFHYHKHEITALQKPKQGVNDSLIKLQLKDFKCYCSTVQAILEFQDLKRKQNSHYIQFDKDDAVRLDELKRLLPDYLQVIRLRKLKIEEWSFIKILYGHLKKDQFLKLICSFDYTFFDNLRLVENGRTKSKSNPIQILFTNHCVKIAEGKIIFV